MANRSERFFLGSGPVETSATTGVVEVSTSSGALLDGVTLTSPTGVIAGVDAAGASPDSIVESAVDCSADESTEDRSAESLSVRVADGRREVRSGDELRVERVSDESRVGFVVDRPEPNVVRGFVPDAVDPLVEAESVSAVDELSDELESDDEEELESEDDCPPSSANAVPIPAVPTNPATPSENATAPTRNATLAK